MKFKGKNKSFFYLGVDKLKYIVYNIIRKGKRKKYFKRKESEKIKDEKYYSNLL